MPSFSLSCHDPVEKSTEPPTTSDVKHLSARSSCWAKRSDLSGSVWNLRPLRTGTSGNMRTHIYTNDPERSASQAVSFVANGCAAHSWRRLLTLGPKTCSLFTLITSPLIDLSVCNNEINQHFCSWCVSIRSQTRREHSGVAMGKERDRDLSFFPLFPWHIILQRTLGTLYGSYATLLTPIMVD